MPARLVSIIINNHNYGRFLRSAVDSALAQTWRPLEVIVVDDGSADDSRAIVASYGAAIVPVLKENGGQASAFNAGFAASQGEVVTFLDADDMLVPETAARVVAAFAAQPEAAKVHYRLEVIDADGARTGVVRPAWNQPLVQGDLRPQVLAFPDDIPWQPTSGNAFAARVLRQILPMPESTYRLCADYYLSSLPPLFGPVSALAEVGGYYRVHGGNGHHTDRASLEQSREIITRTCQTHRHIKCLADKLQLPGFPADPADVLAVSFLAHRLYSLRLDPARHPLPGDRPGAVAARGVLAALGRFDLHWLRRGACALWFVAALAAPRPTVSWLAQQFFHPATRRAS